MNSEPHEGLQIAIQAAHIESLEKQLEELRSRFEIVHEALDEVAFHGTSRPVEMGEGDDGDGHYKRIAYALISRAAIARRMVR